MTRRKQNSDRCAWLSCRESKKGSKKKKKKGGDNSFRRLKTKSKRRIHPLVALSGRHPKVFEIRLTG